MKQASGISKSPLGLSEMEDQPIHHPPRFRICSSSSSSSLLRSLSSLHPLPQLSPSPTLPIHPTPTRLSACYFPPPTVYRHLCSFLLTTNPLSFSNFWAQAASYISPSFFPSMHGGPKVFQNDAYRGKENNSLTRTARSTPLTALVSE